ncbi:hypothetical protein GLA29479_301 [Lysobacter antibioticus]|uniref:Uncharacterized protein n=1 Tax=Lysobacter antibioticus TaxID=84531 RepID=A0A0S2FI50_LYSAN|nr:hypothetical protein GLA29479_301 [Lysobacter antibioticus]ALN83244.1 hypothetical protein LA76x_5142 [Lysobacter antibioticus]
MFRTKAMQAPSRQQPAVKDQARGLRMATWWPARCVRRV